MLQRASSKLLDGKGTKDQLAALKILESRLDSYALKLKDVIYTEREEVVPRQSHEVIIDFTSQFLCSTASVESTQQGSVHDVARLIALRLVPAMRGDASDALDKSDISELDQVEVEVEVEGVVQPSISTPCTVSDTDPTKATTGVSDSNSVTQGTETRGTEEGHSLITHINEGLTGLKEREKAALLENCEEVKTDISTAYLTLSMLCGTSSFHSLSSSLSSQLLHYLKVNVTPFLATDLIQIERTRPSDPIEFLITALEAQSKKNREEAEENALKEFHRVLREAEMENMAAAGSRRRQ